MKAKRARWVVVEIMTFAAAMLIFLSSTLLAQCTDADSDGYYYEAGCGTPRDCNDADVNINPGSAETCNGFDDDCDGSLDEGCEFTCSMFDKLGEESRVTNDPLNSNYSSLTWTGDGYGIVWRDTRDDGYLEIYFARYDASGAKIGNDMRLTYDAKVSSWPSLTWTGSGYGVSWYDDRDGNTEIYFARLDPSGNKIGSDSRVTSNSSSSLYPSLVWTGSEYGISWYDSRDGNSEIYFARLDPSGSKIGADSRVTSNSSSSNYPSLVWTGSEYGISWHDFRDGNSEIYFSRLDPSGSKIGTESRITSNSSSSLYPSLVWIGGQFAVSWDESRDGNSEIYFARIACCDDDNDLDSFKECKDCDDNNNAVYPGAPQLCDGFNNDCFHPAWPSLTGTNEWDDDGDGYSECAGDCDDADPAVSLFSEEICDGKDNDCDGTIDEGFSYTDADGDGHYSLDSCRPPHDDCDDNDPNINPDAQEIICNGIFESCGGNGNDAPDLDTDGFDACGLLDINNPDALERDCDEFDPLVHPGAADICNGFDDDCDGFLDDDCDTACSNIRKEFSDVRISSGSSSSDYSSLVWTGSGFGIAWADERDKLSTREIYFARLDPLGNKIGSDVRVSFNDAYSYSPSLAWNGREYGLSWYDYRNGNQEIYFARIDSQGNRIGSEMRITYDEASSISPCLVWNGSEYGLSWYDNRDGNDEIYFARLDSEGRKIGSDERITHNGSGSSSPWLVWTGREYAVSWEDERDGEGVWEIYFARFDPAGNKIGSDVRISFDDSLSLTPSLVWTGNGYGVSWEDSRDGNWEVYIAMIDLLGSKIGSDVRVTFDTSSSEYNSLVWTGSEFGVAWDDYLGSNDIYLARLDGAGNKIVPDVRVTDNPSMSWYSTLVWTGSGFRVAWQDDRNGNYEIYSALVGCCTAATDADGDTWCESDCNKNDPSVYPGAAEYCDFKDNDCDARIDNKDWDKDGFIDSHCTGGNDCNDENAKIYFGAHEVICNGIDEACDGGTNETPNMDGDGYDACDYGDILNPDGRERDCNDASGSINALSPETCNGFDDNCNGLIDEGCDTLCSNPKKEAADTRVTIDPSASENPSITWTGNGFGICWSDGRNGNSEIYCALLDTSGNKVGNDIRLTNNSSFSEDPFLIWTGREFAATWRDNRDLNNEIYFVRFDPSGNKIGSDIRVTLNSAYSMNPALVWTGSEYGITWYDDRDGNYEIYFARLEPSGRKIGVDVRITADPADSKFPSLVWTGREYLISWHDERDGNAELYLSKLDSSGNKIGSDVRITHYPSDSYLPSLAWTGSDLGLSWYDGRDGNAEIYLTHMDLAGNKIGSDMRITQNISGSYYSSLIWNGSEYGLAWRDYRAGNWEIYFTRIDPSGNRIDPDIRITHDPSYSQEPSIVWTGNDYTLCWHDGRDGNSEIYFAKIRCDRAPVANAGDNSQSECASPEGALMTLDGSGSADSDSSQGSHDDIVQFEWFENFDLPSERWLGEGERLDVTLPLGMHAITLKVTDSAGETNTDEVIKTVVDTVPPEISLRLVPDTLWPPNHRMVDIEAHITITDVCGISAVMLSTVTSSEPDDAPGNGDGNTVLDIQDADTGMSDFHFKLRAERDAVGDGRSYYTVYRAADLAGNLASASASALVPHDMNGSTEAIQLQVSETSRGTLVTWNEIAGANYYNVIRGNLADISETESSIELGTVICIESGSIDTRTDGWEDAENPPPGEAFFYLVEYNDGADSSYGTVSAAKPRVPNTGSCP